MCVWGGGGAWWVVLANGLLGSSTATEVAVSVGAWEEGKNAFWRHIYSHKIKESSN